MATVRFAVGIIQAGRGDCRLRHGEAAFPPSVLWWACVVGRGSDVRGANVLLAPCDDVLLLSERKERYVRKQRSCQCKTVFWFERAFRSHPGADFVAKVEDDSIVHYAALAAALSPSDRALPVWVGLMQWAVHEEGRTKGRYCFHHRSSLSFPEASACRPAWKSGVVAPFATGALDVRSRPFLAMLVSSCPATFRNTSVGSCDAGAGYQAARCIHAANRSGEVEAVHVGQGKVGLYPSAGKVVLHAWKNANASFRWKGEGRDEGIERFRIGVRQDGGRLIAYPQPHPTPFPS